MASGRDSSSEMMSQLEIAGAKRISQHLCERDVSWSEANYITDWSKELHISNQRAG
jgi:hypothetical protein